MSYYIMLFYIILYIIYIHIWLETTNQPFLADGFTSPFGTWWERWTDGQAYNANKMLDDSMPNHKVRMGAAQGLG